MHQLRCIGMLAASAVLWIAATGAASAADFPKGIFTLKGPDNATWAVKFDGKDKFTVTRDGKEGVEGMYKVTKDEIEFTDEKGPFAQKGDAKTGSYKWKLTDTKLTFTKVKDESKGRFTILTSGAWMMTKDTFRGVADHMVKAINAADYHGVRRDFNQVMLKAFPVEKCKAFFQEEISAKFGKINKLEPAQFKSAAEAVFVARCERGTLEFTLVLDEQGKVAGMLFRPRSDLPVPQKNETKLALPFQGRWLVFWGGDTAELNHHHHDRAQRFAFDLLGVGPDGKTHKGDGSRNEDYYAFGCEVLAPADGVVTEVIDGVRDNMPGSMNPLSALGNAVFIQHSKHEVSVLAHFKQSSIKVKAGDTVKKGQMLGLCGNSGNSSEPHLHYHLQNTAVIQDATGIKCYFEEVSVEKEGIKSTQQNYSPVKGDIVSPVKKN